MCAPPSRHQATAQYAHRSESAIPLPIDGKVFKRRLIVLPRLQRFCKASLSNHHHGPIAKEIAADYSNRTLTHCATNTAAKAGRRADDIHSKSDQFWRVDLQQGITCNRPRQPSRPIRQKAKSASSLGGPCQPCQQAGA